MKKRTDLKSVGIVWFFFVFSLWYKVYFRFLLLLQNVFNQTAMKEDHILIPFVELISQSRDLSTFLRPTTIFCSYIEALWLNYKA